mgnify:CR=1 FL=1
MRVSRDVTAAKRRKRIIGQENRGAPEGNNLEPLSAPELLEELENWSEVLKSEPEVVHRLSAFAEAVEGEPDDSLDTPAATASFEEPSP